MSNTDDAMLREAIKNGHHRVSVSVGVNSPVATIETYDLLRLIHAAQERDEAVDLLRGLMSPNGPKDECDIERFMRDGEAMESRVKAWLAAYEARHPRMEQAKAEGPDEVGEQGLRPSSDGANP